MPKPRKVSGRAPRDRILILTEGEETERNYFFGLKEKEEEKLKKFALDVKVGKTNKNTPFELVEDAIAQIEDARIDRNMYEESWVVFDRDKHPKMNEAFMLAKKHGIKVAFTNIAFEYWILLHFRKSTKPYLCCDDVINDLRKYVPNYNKNNVDIYLTIKDKQSDALENAKFVKSEAIKNHSGNFVYDANPYINLDELIERLLTQSEIYAFKDSFKL